MPDKRDRTPPLLRAFGLLERVAAADGAATLQDLAAGAGLPKPTVYRMLAMLESAGLVTREPDGRRIGAGPRLLRFALDVQLSASAHAPRHAILNRLATELGETVNLTMLDGSEVVYLDRVEAEWPLRMTLQPGSHVPLHCTASGKLLLALLPATRRRRIVAELPLPRYTEHTLATRKALGAELAAIRRDGYATDNEEYLAGLVCVAVPVMTSAGRNVACVAVHAPVARMTLARALEHVPALKRAATALGATFGDTKR
ncbi:MAG: IclR family transcriptional regulator [Burkholderiales bacterium]|nr:IclR family transcriptional regulator [Burkholderiales bacterium]